LQRPACRCAWPAARKSVFLDLPQDGQKHLSFAQVTDIYGFRLIVPTLLDCYTALGCCTSLYKPVPGRFKDHIAIAKLNGYQSLHTTLVGPAGVNIEFQLRTESMHLVAESGSLRTGSTRPGTRMAATHDRLGNQWLQSLLDIQRETGDAAEFWDHVKVDLFPDAVYVFTPKQPDPVAAARRDCGGLCLCHPQQCRRPYHGCADQWRAGAAAHRTQERRCRGSRHSASIVKPKSGMAEFCADRPRALQDPAPLKTLAQRRIGGLRQETAGAGAARRRHRALPGRRRSRHTSVVWERLLRFTGNRTNVRSC
jgi:guanosine-3',5'-bis(diphosphate) 3'-pyrophosphohydrolase